MNFKVNHPIRTQTPAIDKAVLVFDYLAEHAGATFTEIFQGVNLPKSTASSLLASLVTHGLLRQEKNNYYLGIRFYEYGKKVEDFFDIRQIADEPLSKLRDQTGLTCHLGILEGASAIYLLKMESPGAVVVRSWVGKRLSLHSSGLGKALLAWLSDEQVDKLLPDDVFEVRTSTTIETKKGLKAELAKIRSSGWAFDNEEDSQGVFCIAAPIFNEEKKVIAAISASGVSFQVTKERIPEIVELVKQSAHEISRRIYE